MAENLDETQEPQGPTLNEINETNLEIIDAGDITTVYSSKAKPVLNIKWDLENPLASEAGLASENGISNVSNTLVAGGFRRSEIDNIIGKNTSVFVSNVTTELYGNGTNAANQISSQQPKPLLVRKRLIRIIDIWNRIIFGMNINARDNASMNRFFGANLQTNADVLFRNQISHTVSGTTFNETNSWTWLVNPDPSFIFSQVSRFLYACIFEIKEKIKLLNKIVDGVELNLDIEALGINNNTDTFNIQGTFNTTQYTSLLEPVHIIPDITHKVWNWSVEPTNANSKFQLLGAFAKHIPQKYSIMLFEPNFLVLLQELIDIIMDMPEEEHFSEIFNGLYVNSKDVRLIEVLVKELAGTGESGGPTSESKIDFDSVHFTGIESIQNEPTKTSHIQFNDIYNFYLKYKNDFDFINETNTYNTKKKKYRYYEDVRVWDEKTALRKEWNQARKNYLNDLLDWTDQNKPESEKPIVPQILIDYPLIEPNEINPDSLPGPELTALEYFDTNLKYINYEPLVKITHNQLSYNPQTNLVGFSNPVSIKPDGFTPRGSSRFATKTPTGYNFYLLSALKDANLMETHKLYHLIKFNNNMEIISSTTHPLPVGLSSSDGNILKGKYFYAFNGVGNILQGTLNDNGELENWNAIPFSNVVDPSAYNEYVWPSNYYYKSVFTILDRTFIVGPRAFFEVIFNSDNTINKIILYKWFSSEPTLIDFNRATFQSFIHRGKLFLIRDNGFEILNININGNNISFSKFKTIDHFDLTASLGDTKFRYYFSNVIVDKDRFYFLVAGKILFSIVLDENFEIKTPKVEFTFPGYEQTNVGEFYINVLNNKLIVHDSQSNPFNLVIMNTSGWDIHNNPEYFVKRELYSGTPKPLPEVAAWANTRSELSELRKYDFVDEPFMDYHLPYKDNPQYKFPITKNTEQINTLNTRFKNWIKLQKESYTNLDKLLTVFEYCSDLTSDVRYRSRWDHGKTKRSGATHYDIGNRIDNIISLNISKLSTRLGIEYFKSLDNYNKKVHNKELDPNSPKPTPFFKNKIFSTEVYSGFNSGAVERNWKFGWSIVKFPKKFEIAPKIDETEATIVNGEKYIPCSWFSSGSSEILFPRQFIDTADEDDEMYIGFYNACTSFGVTAQMEELFRQRHPLLTGTENMHGTSLVTVNTLKPQIHTNFFKLAFIGDSTGKYFPDSQEELDVSPYGIDRETITKADIFVNIKADDDYPNKDEKFIESMDDEFDKPFVDSFKNIKIFYKLN